MRLFFSIDLPDALEDDVARVQEPLAEAEGLRLTDPGQAHITMKFLGEVDDDAVEELTVAAEAAVAAADTGPIEVDVGGLGVFPSLEYISVVWAGVGDGAPAVARLHEALEARVTDLGYEAEDHDFTPHVTLARMDDARGKDLVQEQVRETDPDLGRFTAEELRLTKSELTDEGPEYETVRSVEL